MQKQINIKCAEAEYDYISGNASLLDKTVTAYVKELALSQNIINYDYDALNLHTKELTNIKKILNDILFNIIKNGETYKGDIQTVLLIISQLNKSENELKTLFRKDRETKRKYIKKCVDNNFQKLLADKEL